MLYNSGLVGYPETDSDKDGTPDCVDNCPNDSGKTDPGACGCGVADTDTDSDGTPDCNDEVSNIFSCFQWVFQFS